MFKDRADAGRQLAKRLERYRGQGAVVLALPRGGVVLGAEVARELSLPLDIVVVRKIGHPLDPERAIGAVDAQGATLMENEREPIDEAWLRQETAREVAEAKRREALYRGGRAPVALAGKVAILVDDGIATGLTMRLAVAAVATQKPRTIVVAVPVAPASAVAALSKDAEVVVLEEPEDFLGAVGAHYEEFEQVGDSEVVHLVQAE